MRKMSTTLRVEKASIRTWGRLTPTSLVLLFMLLFISSRISAQIETMYSLYRFNPQVLTPVQAGSTMHSELILMHRNQWIGIEGAPRNFGFSGNFKWGQKKGVGFTAMVDEAGPVRSTILGGDFAYHIKLNEGWNLDGGIRLGLANIALNFSQIRLVNSNDALFSGDRSTGIQPNLGYGVRLAKNNDGFFVSFSQPRVLKYDFGAYSGAFRDVAYYYLMTGTRIGLGGKTTTSNGVFSRVTLYPSLLIRMATDVPLSYDVNLTANLMGKFDVGLNYRKEDSFGLRLGVQATRKIYLGYVYELPISEIRKASSQSHEFAVRYFLMKDKKDVKVNKDELRIEDSERSNKNAVLDFGPYVKKEQAEPQIVNKVETVVAEAAPIAAVVETKKEEIKQEVKVIENTQKQDLEEIKIVQATKPAVVTTTKSTVEESEEDFEYVTVTKTRVVLKRPKVSNTAVNKVVNTAGATAQVKKVVKRKPRPKVAVSSEPKEIDPNAPIVTRKRISNNITETTVEKRGATESEIGSDGKTKVSKRKRKDGTEETTYTTTEVVKKKKEK